MEMNTFILCLTLLLITLSCFLYADAQLVFGKEYLSLIAHSIIIGNLIYLVLYQLASKKEKKD